MILIDFPLDIFHHIGNEWIHFCDIVNIDSAMSNHSQRDVFLMILREHQNCFIFHEHEPSMECLRWIWARGVAIDQLCLTPVTIMFMACQPVESVVFVLYRLTNVVIQDRCGCISESLCRCLITILTNLTDLRRLRSLVLNVHVNDSFRHVLHLLLTKAEKLESFRTKSRNRLYALNDQDVKTISILCPKLTSFQSDDYFTQIVTDMLTDKSMYSLADNSHMLSHLSIKQCRNINTSLVGLAYSPCAKHLRVLCLDMGEDSSITIANLSVLLARAPNLTLITLTRYSLRTSEIVAGILAAIACCCPQLIRKEGSCSFQLSEPFPPVKVIDLIID